MPIQYSMFLASFRRWASVLVVCVFGLDALPTCLSDESVDVGSLTSNQFVNPIGEGADPWVIRDPNAERYLWCFSEGNRGISIQSSDSLTSLGTKHFVWEAPETGPYSKEVWAPELHHLDDRWYVYFAASNGKNENHRAYVLRSKTTDPLGEYELIGPLATGDGEDRDSPNIWAIDMTVLQFKGHRYAVWSGWDAPGTDRQYLYIAAMKSPTELVGPRVRLCANDDFLWERTEPRKDARGLNEGPQVFQANGRTTIVYSCAASWLPTYKLGLLELHGDDPLDPMSWKKHPEPVFQSSSSTYGVGHSCFVRSPGGDQWWHVFHAKRDRRPGWRRAIFVQPMKIGERDIPQFGKPIDAGTVLERPSGETQRATPASIDDFSYYGHHQFIHAGRQSVRLGSVAEAPINAYRCGEKVVFRGAVPDDVDASVTIDFLGNDDARDAGLLFRCSAASVGYDAQRAYFAGLIPKTNLVILGKTDGTNWTELARAETSFRADTPQELRVRVTGDLITVWHRGEQKLSLRDAAYSSGRIGLRVVDTDAVFSGLEINDATVEGD